MPDAVKAGFVPISTTPRGVLVTFCDDTLKFGPATRKALGEAASLVKRAAATNQSRIFRFVNKGRSSGRNEAHCNSAIGVTRL